MATPQKPPKVKAPKPIFYLYTGADRVVVEHEGNRWALDPRRPSVVVDDVVWPELQKHPAIAAALADGTLKPVSRERAETAREAAIGAKPMASPAGRAMVGGAK